MSEQETTPGEWRLYSDIDGTAIVYSDLDKTHIATVFMGPHRRDIAGARVVSMAEGKANARLIAASPILLDACRELVEICTEQCGSHNEVVLASGKTNHAAIVDAYIAIAAAANGNVEHEKDWHANHCREYLPEDK